MSVTGHYRVHGVRRAVLVIVAPMGAEPELVADGETGFLCPELADMVEAVNRLREISPTPCRSRLAGNFTDEVMVEGYETIFEQVLAGR